LPNRGWLPRFKGLKGSPGQDFSAADYTLYPPTCGPTAGVGASSTARGPVRRPG